MVWDIWQIIEGRGLVDYLGQVDATTQDEAEAYAAETFDCAPGKERLEVEEATEPPPV